MSDDGSTATFWVDVSQHDRARRAGPLDWAAIRDATSPVMCARAWYGDPQGFNPPSPYWDEFQQGAKAAGFVARGGYLDLIHGDQASINRQIDAFRQRLDAHGCQWAMFDPEPYTELKNNGLWPRWDDIRRAHDRWYQVEDRTASWYIPRWFWSNDVSQFGLGRPDLKQLRGPWIQSHYLDGVYGSPREIYDAGGGNSGTGWDDIAAGRYPDGWQYSATCTCPGATAQTDVNAFRGNLDQLVELLTGRTVQRRNKMLVLVKHLGDPKVYVADGLTRRLLPTQTDLDDIRYLGSTGQIGPLYNNGEIREVANLDVYGAEIGAAAAVNVDAGQLAAALVPLLPKFPSVEEIAAAMGKREAAAERASAEILDGP